jgi:hypothetical protein
MRIVRVVPLLLAIHLRDRRASARCYRAAATRQTQIWQGDGLSEVLIPLE